MAVITNTDYIYSGESTRTAHFDYRLQLVTGVTGTASVNTRWYKWNTLTGARAAPATATADKTNIGVDMSKYCFHSYQHPAEVAEVNKLISPIQFQAYPNPLSNMHDLTVEFIAAGDEKTLVSILTADGVKVYETTATGNTLRVNTSGLKKGLYLVKVSNSTMHTSQKLIIN
jgi:hypothetical protein